MERVPLWIDGKTALVTGAAKRIGKSTALALAKRNVNLVLHYRSSSDEAESVSSECMSMGVKSWTVQADLRDPEQAEELIEKTSKEAGPIQILVNNASIFTKSQLMDFSLQDLEDNIQVNAISPILIGRAFAKQGCEGAIVNFLDTRITEYDSGHAAYHLSKRMLFTLTRMMALEFAPSVRVNAIAPGLILPPPGEDVSYLQKLAPTNPLNSIGSPEGIIDSVLFLLNSQFVTGQVIFVDGGYHMKGSVYG
jgi:NAD(P)-dependent dehydrogenase (short-subunit alcohol dehydrogenase family)